MFKKCSLAALALVASAATAMADEIKLGLQPWLGYGPLWVAEQKGFFADHGIEVDLTTFSWDQDMTAALASGNLDVIAAATNGVIASYNVGLDQKGFLIMDLSFEADAIMAGNDIASVADLKGKDIAFESGSTSDLLLNYALRQNGMSIADVNHIPMGASEAGLALISGRVEAAVTYEPYISGALAQSDENRVLFTAAEKPGLISDMLTSSSTWINAHPDDVRGLILAWDDAVKFIRENPDEGGAIIAEAVGSSMEEFTPAFEGVRLYTISEMAQFLGGDFQATIQEIGEIMAETNPEHIKQVPAADEILAVDALMSMQ